MMGLVDSAYGVILSKNVMVAMRDGVRLATDVFRPARDGEFVAGTFPTILCRTSYDKSAQRYVDYADYFTPRGYVVVLQDVRGRYRSEGMGQYRHTANPHEGPDGYDTVEWIAAQAWSNGNVGTVGSSYPAVMQLQMALYRPPHLAAIWPDVCPINMYDHQSRTGGAMAMQMFGALFVHAVEAQEVRNTPGAQDKIMDAMEHMRELVYATPFKPRFTPLNVVPNLESVLFDYYYRGAYDEFWAQEYNDFARYFDRHADVPATHSGGWYDLFAKATPIYFNRMREQNKSPQRLIMGPWNHTGMRAGLSFAGDVDFGPDAAWGLDKYFAEQLRFFDRWLKDVPNDLENDPRVRIFVMGGGDGSRTREGKLNHGGRWRNEQEFPLARTKYTNFYLHADGDLTPDTSSPKTRADANSELRRDDVSPNPSPARRGDRRFAFDPAHPVPTIGASSSGLMELVPLSDKLDPFWSKQVSPWLRLNSIVIEGAAHQKEEPGMVAARPPYLPLAMRPDVLVFQTAPLEQDVQVTGYINVHLWVSSSAVDTDFTAKLIDVYPPNRDYPDGYHLNLTDSILRVRYRNGFDHEELMTPGETYPITIELAPTSNLFQKGHRIRLDISSSNFPRFDVNPNTGEPMGRHTHIVVAHNTVYCDAEHPSHVVLPVIPSRLPN